MRTTITLPDILLRQLKNRASQTGRTMSAVIEDAVRAAFLRDATGRIPQVVLPTFRGNGLRPGVDLDNSAALLDSMNAMDVMD